MGDRVTGFTDRRKEGGGSEGETERLGDGCGDSCKDEGNTSVGEMDDEGDAEDGEVNDEEEE